MRFGMRSDIENPNIKNYAIDEIQADINQSVGKSMRAARDRNDPDFRRLNPYNLDFIKNRLPRKRVSEASEIIPLIKLLTSKDGEMMAGTSVTIDACETKAYNY